MTTDSIGVNANGARGRSINTRGRRKKTKRGDKQKNKNQIKCNLSIRQRNEKKTQI